MRVFLELFDPFRDVLVGGTFGEIKDDECSRSPLVVCMSYRPITLLARSIPNLRFYFVALEIDSLGGEFNTDRRFGFVGELIFLEPRQEICLTNSRILN